MNLATDPKYDLLGAMKSVDQGWTDREGGLKGGHGKSPLAHS